MSDRVCMCGDLLTDHTRTKTGKCANCPCVQFREYVPPTPNRPSQWMDDEMAGVHATTAPRCLVCFESVNLIWHHAGPMFSHKAVAATEAELAERIRRVFPAVPSSLAAPGDGDAPTCMCQFVGPADCLVHGDQLAADARLGAALREALATVPNEWQLAVYRLHDGSLGVVSESYLADDTQQVQSDETSALAALLRSSPARDATGDEP